MMINNINNIVNQETLEKVELQEKVESYQEKYAKLQAKLAEIKRQELDEEPWKANQQTMNAFTPQVFCQQIGVDWATIPNGQ